MAPSSRFALSLKPNVAYLVLNFCALWKKQTTLPSLAYAGIPYQSLGERAGALALMMAWSRSPRARSGSGISAIFASTSLSPSALAARGPRRAAAFSSWARSFIAARSSSRESSGRLAGRGGALGGLLRFVHCRFPPLRVLMGMTLMLGNRGGGGFFETDRSLPG